MAKSSSPSGWFPDAAQPGVERYFDGSAWTSQTRPSGVGDAPVNQDQNPEKKKWSKGKIIGIAAAAIVLVAVGVNMGKGDKPKDDAKPVAEASEAAQAPAKPAESAPAAEEAPAAETADAEAAAQVEPAAPTADGSVANPLPQPYVAKGLLGGEKYSLTARVFDANASGAVNEWNQFNSQPPAGFKYVVVELTMTGLDKDGVEPMVAAWDLSLATAEGNKYTAEFVVFGEGMSSMADGPTLYPGSSFTGYTAYMVPDTAASFLLYDNSKYVAIS